MINNSFDFFEVEATRRNDIENEEIKELGSYLLTAIHRLKRQHDSLASEIRRVDSMATGYRSSACFVSNNRYRDTTYKQSCQSAISMSEYDSLARDMDEESRILKNKLKPVTKELQKLEASYENQFPDAAALLKKIEKTEERISELPDTIRCREYQAIPELEKRQNFENHLFFQNGGSTYDDKYQEMLKRFQKEMKDLKKSIVDAQKELTGRREALPKLREQFRDQYVRVADSSAQSCSM